ncbi:type VII secretion target [Mycolicibacterium tusciae]|uniref:type VII secretion target n=1 Tax=Mycolicibacterium tusciae TaxID=75922 RepID=UPI0009F1FFB9|nr:type VII secretion target [Mycolicibacterium tusciae]
MTEDLRVDTALVRQSGGKLETIAGLLPEPPASFSPAGADALSTAIAGRVSEVVDPVLAQMPIAKDELTRYAQNVMEAADSYDAADRRIAEEILKQLGILDEAAGGGSAAPGGASAAPPSAGSGTAGAPAAGAAQSDQMGQLMQMPMQLAQQAAQIPMQLAGMAAAIPQAMMQGVQTAVQQATQMAQSGEGDEMVPEDETVTPEEAREERAEDRVEAEPEATPGNSAGERVPDAGPQVPSAPEAPPAPKPAPTRPAESGPESAL